MGFGANDQAVADNRRGGHAEFAQAVLAEKLELGSCLDYESVAVFAEAEDLAVIGPGR